MIFLVFIIPGSARADCSAPAGTAGAIIFDENTASLQYCNGANWIAFSKDAPASGWKQVVGGKDWDLNFTCGITNNGDGYCWGSDSNGKLGNGAALTANQTRPSPIAGGHKWKQLSLGGSHACGIRTDNVAMCWGLDSNQQLGNGASTTTQHEPVEVSGGHKWYKISLGTEHSCGIRTDGVAMCWGSDGDGRLGNGSTGATNIPGAVTGGHTWIDISAGNEATCGVTITGAGYCWGRAANGRLGNGTTTPNMQDPSLITGYTFQSIASGNGHACGLTTAGAIYCWGGASFGELGNGANSDVSSPVAVSGTHTYKALASGLNMSCGITTTDDAYCWGGDDYGALGTAGWNQNTPTILSGGHKWASLGLGFYTNCGIRTDGEVMCWGKANRGALGNGTTTPNAEAPAAISDNNTKPSCTLETFTPSTINDGYVFNDITFGKGLFVAVEASNDNNKRGVWTSEDGLNWTRRATINEPLFSVTYTNGLFVAGQHNWGGSILTSTDGINWTTDNSDVMGNQVWTISGGNGVFVAGSRDGTQRLATSTDGVNWTYHTVPTDAEWGQAAYGNGRFVVISNTWSTAQPYLVSTDNGATWAAQTAPSIEASSITFGNGLFVVVGTHGRISTSPDGTTWTPRTSNTSGHLRRVVYSNGLFLAVAADGTYVTSSDGITWAAQSGIPSNEWSGLAYGNGRFVAVSWGGWSNNETNRTITASCTSYCTNPAQPAGTIMFNNATRVMQWCDGTNWQAAGPVNPGGATIGCASPAGVAGDMIFNDDYKTVQYCDGGKWRGMGPSMCSEWNTYATPENPASNSIHRAFFANNIFVAASGPTNGNNILTSTDGANWALTNFGNVMGRAITHDGTKFVAIQAYTSRNVYTSTDGLSWTPHTNALPSPATEWEGIAYGDGVFIAIARNGRIAKSTNGTSWANVTTLANSGLWWDIAYGNGRFVAGALGWSATDRIAVSTDGGDSWAMATDSKLQYKAFQNLKFRNGLFLGATNYDGIMSSPDGFTWTNPVSMPAGDWVDVEFDGSKYYAVAQGGTNRLASSTNAINWTPITPPLTTAWFNLAYGNGNLVALAGGVGTTGPAGDRAMRMEFSECD